MRIRRVMVATVAVIALGSACSGESDEREGAIPTVPISSRQLGVAHPAWADDEYDLPASSMIIDRAAELGINWIALSATWYQPTPSASGVGPVEGSTVTDEGVKKAVEHAHAQGLRVMFTPYVDVSTGEDRARIQPADIDAWFRSYDSMIKHYASLARMLNVDQFVVGAELAGTTQYEDEWRSVVRTARNRYPGPILYAANFDEDVRFWDAVDAIGIDAYYSLSDVPTRDVDDLVSAWDAYTAKLQHLSATFRKGVVFTELGYPSQRGATVEPWNAEQSTTVDEREQLAAYQAFEQAVWRQPWLVGVHFWMAPDIPGRSTDRQELDFSPFGKPAEAVIRQLSRELR